MLEDYLFIENNEINRKQISDLIDRYVNNNKKDIMEVKKWKRYRFKTKSIKDFRPLVFNPKYPWWCSGSAVDESHVTIVAYLPITEDLFKYWDDAFDIDFTEEEKIIFSDRFAKPDYFVES